MDTRKKKKKERTESSKMAKFEAPGIKEWIVIGVWIFQKIRRFVWKKVTGEQVLFTSNIFPINPLKFPKIQTAINTHSLILEASYFWHDLFISGICFIPWTLLVTDKVKWPCHAKSLL